MRTRAFALLCALLLVSPAFGWNTYRGNPQRTGNTDGKAGPAQPKVLWVFKSNEHFVSSPVPSGDRLYISGVGAFNVSTFHTLALDPKGDKQLIWSKSTPVLKLPVVSSPAIADDKLVFGDGMHQTDGASLHVWSPDGEKVQWSLPVDGKLVHLEGSPTVVNKRAYLGGGAAGVLCVDLERLTFDGKEMPIAEINKELEKRWAALLKKYDEDYKKDPCFTIKPTRDKLPKPAPMKVWQEGAEKWHVDAPVNVVGDNVLVCSAFLEKEKVGDRALFCLDAKTGKLKWRAPLTINPWGGASVQDNVVVVTGSTARYDTTEIKGAKGEIAAFDLATGKPLWAKPVKGGILGCAALTKELAIVPATDGKVRAYNLSDGMNLWVYDVKFPVFAAAAVVDGVAYVGDLSGTIHAINVADHSEKWKLSLATDPAVKAPGMVYGGPIVHGGRVYVATCTLQDMPGSKDTANKPTAVVCIGQ